MPKLFLWSLFFYYSTSPFCFVIFTKTKKKKKAKNEEKATLYGSVSLDVPHSSSRFLFSFLLVFSQVADFFSLQTKGETRDILVDNSNSTHIVIFHKVNFSFSTLKNKKKKTI